MLVSPDSIGPSAALSVYHDVWGTCDFRGTPHPAVYARNAPRLAAALRELDTLLGVEAKPGEPTYFGMSKAYGVKDAFQVLVDFWDYCCLANPQKAASRRHEYAEEHGRDPLAGIRDYTAA
ncbi:hypothetical protein [Streptomyces sp. NPDC029003]|uniref:hypothetical protein n=1 Tax=Streptomyces sp. NPDC029003 TaxID=3155125 RepID=UPI0033D244A4